MEAAKEEIQQLEEDPPEKLEDWPDGQAKYETFGGAEGDHSYDEGPEAKLGPGLGAPPRGRQVEVGGEKADDPDEYKGEPIPGGPTDPDAKEQPGRAAAGGRRRGRRPRGRHLGGHVRGRRRRGRRRAASGEDCASRPAGAGSGSAAAAPPLWRACPPRRRAASPAHGPRGLPPGPDRAGRGGDAALLDVPQERRVGLGGVLLGLRSSSGWSNVRATDQRARPRRDHDPALPLLDAVGDRLAGLRERIGLAERAAHLRAEPPSAGCASAPRTMSVSMKPK